ncbi:MAG: hypothetical protein PF447_02370 [Spirochaetaceae bacterium]|nr:hypothetical protein [Spirochaetaceae bacterium]
MDPQMDVFFDSHRSVRIRAFLKGNPSKIIMEDSIDEMLTILDEISETKSYKRVIISPYYWENRRAIYLRFPQESCYWIMGNPDVEKNSLTSSWEELSPQQWVEIMDSLGGNEIILLYEGDPLSLKRKNVFIEQFENSGLIIEPVILDSSTWQNTLENIEFQQYSDVLMIAPGISANLWNFLQKWEIPIGGEIPGNIRAEDFWSFALREPWQKMLYISLVLIEEDLQESLRLAPDLQTNS